MSEPRDAPMQPEAVLDRDLRRSDWRFLHPGLPLERVADPSPAALRQLAARRDGRGLYFEWRRPVPGGGRALRDELEGAGLEQVELYWPWPGFGRPWFWVPLGSEAAAAYVAASRLAARSAFRRVIDRPLRGLWRRAARAERLWPLGAVARTPGPAPATEPLRDRIAREWSSLGFEPPGGRLSWMLLTRGGRSINKIVGLVFAEPDPAPRIAVKLARIAEAEAGLLREASALTAVHTRTSGGVRGAPRVLFCDDRSGPLALVETALVGRPLFACLTAESYRPLALAATEWLADLAGPPSDRGAAGAAAPVVESALRDFRASFGAVTDAAELRATERLLAPLAALRTVPEHRDFSPWNVHVAPDGGIVAYDWESAEPVGLPLTDLVYFLAHLGFFRDRTVGGDRCPESYRRARDPTTFTGSVHKECVNRYAARVGLDPAHVAGLHSLTWLIHSRSEYRRLVADAGGPPRADTLGRSLFLALWREELRR